MEIIDIKDRRNFYIPGIYQIRNKLNGKIYIGSSRNVARRICYHLWMLKNNRHYNRHIQGAFNIYREQAFEFSLLERTSVEELIIKEQEYLDRFTPYNDDIGYNQNSVAKAQVPNRKSRNGPMPQEQRDKIRKARLGYKWHEDSRKKLSAYRKSLACSEKIRKLIPQEYIDGLDTTQISEKYNLGKMVVWRILKENNVKMRSRWSSLPKN